MAAGERDAAKVAEAARAQLTSEGVEPEYFELVSADTLAPLGAIGEDGDGDVLVVVAAQVGATRLIDNQIMATNGRT